MKKLVFLITVLLITTIAFSQENNEVYKGSNLSEDEIYITNTSCDGTPDYRKCVEESYRKLQYKTSIYGEVPKLGSGIRLGIYQIQAAYGEGATEKNMKLLEEAVKLAKKFDVQLLSFPELYVPGYTLSPENVRKVAEYKDGPSITKARETAKKYKAAQASESQDIRHK